MTEGEGLRYRNSRRFKVPRIRVKSKEKTVKKSPNEKKNSFKRYL